MSTGLDVVFTPHWINGWLIRGMYRPWFQVGDAPPMRTNWDEKTHIPIPAGAHVLASFLGWRGAGPGTRLSERRIDLVIPTDAVVSVRVRNGPFNHSPFLAEAVSEPPVS